jgi:cytochrome c oxidase subunit 3
LERNYEGATVGLFLTILLGIYFTFLQGGEYYETGFGIRDCSYGSIFFVGTGFHGLHVIIGTSFLLIILFRVFHFDFNNEHHVGFEAAA